MAEIDYSSVFDTVLPNVYIRKISLFPTTDSGQIEVRPAIVVDPGLPVDTIDYAGYCISSHVLIIYDDTRRLED